MSTLVVSEFVTLDGVMEAPGGEPGHPHTGWVRDFMGPEVLRWKLDEILEAEALLIGRVTWESFAGAWPDRSQGARAGDRDLDNVASEDGGVRRFADKMNGMPKHVVSTTLKDPAWNNSHVIAKDVVREVARLKAKDGGPLLVAGSRTLVHTLAAHDLVDEWRLMVFPVVLGSGGRLFPESPDKMSLGLADTVTFPSGVVVHTYRARR